MAAGGRPMNGSFRVGDEVLVTTVYADAMSGSHRLGRVVEVDGNLTWVDTWVEYPRLAQAGPALFVDGQREWDSGYPKRDGGYHLNREAIDPIGSLAGLRWQLRQAEKRLRDVVKMPVGSVTEIHAFRSAVAETLDDMLGLLERERKAVRDWRGDGGGV